MSQNRSLQLAVLLSLPLLAAPLWAQAAISSTTLPSNGAVQSGTVSASISGSTMNLSVGSSQAVIDWGTAGGTLNAVSGTGGFDVGSSAAVTLNNGSGQSGGAASVLNIDVSGQPSQIDGSIIGNHVNVYVANANGVVVGPKAVVSAPTVALMANGASTAESIFAGGNFTGGAGLASGALSLASGATINAGTVILSGNSDVNIGNAITAQDITLNGEANLTGSLNASTVNVTGGFYSSGKITANDLNVNLTGYVNDNKTGQILANGFTLDAGNSGTVNISLTADGSHAQGFNVFVNGNADIDSGNTTVSVTSPNQNSRLILKASGNLTVNPGNQSNPYGSGPAFQFPGLLYLEGWQSNQVNADLVNAYSGAAPVGYGIFVIAPSITDNYSIYANGSRGINFEGHWNGSGYNPAQSINGQNPSSSSFSFGIPIYFAQSNGSTGLSLVQDQQINNPQTGYNQPENLFLGAVPNLLAKSTTTPATGTPSSTSATTNNSGLEQLVLQDAITESADGNLTTSSPQFQAGYPAVVQGVNALTAAGITPGDGFYHLGVMQIVASVIDATYQGESGAALTSVAVESAQQFAQDAAG
ncbi:MAG: hypothetical protein PHO57_11400 [Acidithiobacillus sp.]|nr:hypothetical protein [Acidithiobacillus sp.]